VIAVLGRLAALAGAPLMALGAVWLLLLAVIGTSLLRSPNPDPALDGDPCCWYPDNWLQVALGAFGVLALVVIALALVGLAAALLWVAVSGRSPELVRRHQSKLGLILFFGFGGVFSLPMVLAFAMSLFG
jgi:hypothetical protein